MKQNKNAGFSLVEVLVAIVILGILSAPVCTSLVVSTRMNTKATELLQAQLAVSSAVETLMAEGINREAPDKAEPYDISEVNGEKIDTFPDVIVTTEKEDSNHNYYCVTVFTEDESIVVTTYIRENAGGDT